MKPWILLVLSALLILSCGSDDGLSCSLNSQTTLMNSDWPTSRHDSANTGSSDVEVGTAQPVVRCLFPRAAGTTACRESSVPSSSIDTTVVVGTDRLLFTTRDGEIHALAFDGTPIDLDEIDILASTNTPLLGEDGTFYVSSSDGTVRRFKMDGDLDATGTLVGAISAAPTMDSEGVVYVGTLGGSLAAVCPNGGLRFNLLVAPTQAGVGVAADPRDSRGRALLLSGGNNGRVQALRYNGDLRWSFFASAPILAPIIIDEERSVYFALDEGGRIFSGDLLEGTGISTFRTARCSGLAATRCDANDDCPAGERCLGERISAAAALGESRLYVATEGTSSAGGDSPGILYAIDIDEQGALSPESAWEFVLPSHGGIRSAPAVAQSCGSELVIFGADLEGAEGTVFAVDETGLRWSVPLEGRIETASPSISDASPSPSGVVYIGTTIGRLYEIAPAQECPAND